MRRRIYIAGPISKGDVSLNVKAATAAASRLMQAGYAVMCPQLSAWMDYHSHERVAAPPTVSAGFSHEVWMENDLPWVAVADAVLRLPGDSSGADQEVAFANSLSIPVFFEMDELLHLFPARATKVPSKAEGDPRYLAILEEMRALHCRKAADYGSDADPLANIRRSSDVGVQPWLAAWIRAKDKVGRIDQYCRKGTLANEGVEDSFMDLAAYAIICLVLFREQQEGV